MTDQEIAKRDEEHINWLNTNNTLKWKSLKGTAEENLHCGLGIPIDVWQARLKELSNPTQEANQ